MLGFEILASTPQGKRKKPLKWPTIDKINSVMTQIYAHAQRHGLIPAELNLNPFRSPKLGGARCKTQSDYEAKVVTPEQMIAILSQLRHSLATFFSSNEVHPSVIQASVRHTKAQTTARYIHAVNTKQVEAQGKFLEAIKIGARNTNQELKVAIGLAFGLASDLEKQKRSLSD
jgi:hypothetical protein